jgi:hypothetical protein
MDLRQMKEVANGGILYNVEPYGTRNAFMVITSLKVATWMTEDKV